ncbi:hypothetical protein KOW79_010773 [Hemibagrus wyckioides]|uniref:Uncharacterized protein n=1 Tax=Hemibagrus wyckioides TaxID=337641 RepID=A0A9D3SNI3_9TELE|nr:hypothetical protein KOW79_010773 [Hemibagrus wyckioides]
MANLGAQRDQNIAVGERRSSRAVWRDSHDGVLAHFQNIIQVSILIRAEGLLDYTDAALMITRALGCSSESSEGKNLSDPVETRESESAGLCSDASAEVITFDTCVSAATRHMKRLPPSAREDGLQGLWKGERSVVGMQRLKADIRQPVEAFCLRAQPSPPAPSCSTQPANFASQPSN